MDRVRINARDSLGPLPLSELFLSCQFLAIWRIITLRVIALTKLLYMYHFAHSSPFKQIIITIPIFQTGKLKP